jgi:hypothetical protein
MVNIRKEASAESAAMEPLFGGRPGHGHQQCMDFFDIWNLFVFQVLLVWLSPKPAVKRWSHISPAKWRNVLGRNA